jgi:orotate phosphoribosyltransferase
LIQEKALSRGKFKLASGQTSDYYIDLSKVVLDSVGLSLIASSIIEEVDSWGKITTVGGPAYGAIPIVSSILTLMHDSKWAMKGFFVRKEIKDYGKQELIEGHLVENDKVILVEDVTTTGGSLLKAINEVQKIAVVTQVISVVDRNQGAYKLFEDKGIPFKSILNISQIL